MLSAENRDDGDDSFFYDDLFMAANKSSQIENLAETQSLVHKLFAMTKKNNWIWAPRP